MKRTSCSACGSADLEQFLDLGESPIADAYTATAQESLDAPRYPLQVAVCGKCRLVQLLEVVPAGVLFGTGYSFYSSASAPLSAYHEQYARGVIDRWSLLCDAGVVEIGCNDGDLLQHFSAFPALGVDPSAGPAQMAADRGIDVLVEPFGSRVANEIRDRYGPQGVVIANHVLAHVEDVSDVMAGIAALLAGNGTAMIEVQYLPDLLVNNAFDLVYHEHRNFFCLSSLEQAAQRHGLKVLDAWLTDRQGGSLRAALGFVGSPEARVNELRISERWLNDFSAYSGMQGRAERIRARLCDLLAASQRRGVTALYGAPGKATTLLNFCGLTAKDLPWCVDSTRAKWRRHIPGTGIPIFAEGYDDKPQSFLLASHNYSHEIMSKNPGHRWIVPFAAPVLFG
jgi:C-methyltransferase C-terminal domain/Putative zinc binding domain/Methyltransferase domain